ncbi:MAG: hypothetical protein KJN70_13970 [Eudoraea sp.]|nr:hypothetical protein [Eudoraea sp.]
MTTKAQQTKAITEAVKAYFNEGASLDDTAMILSKNGVLFTDIQSTIQSVGVSHEWVLTTEKIKARVETAIKGKTVSHFLDVVQIAKELELPQMSLAEKQQAIVEFGKIEKSIAKEPRKFRQFHNSGNHGKIAEWIKSNPEFTAKDLHSSGVITAPNASDYYDEFLAYREFYRA